MRLDPGHREFSHTDPKMKFYIFAIVLIVAILATSNANADVEPEERVADPSFMDSIKNGINAVKNGLGIGVSSSQATLGTGVSSAGGRADMEPEERDPCGAGMLRCGPPTK